MQAIVAATVPQSITKIMEGTILERKVLFVFIRRARELLSICGPIDEFSEPNSSLRKLAGF